MSERFRIKPSKISDYYAYSDFDELVVDSALDEIFYPKAERIATDDGITPDIEDHPLHPSFRGYRNPELDLQALKLAQQQRISAHWQIISKNGVYVELMAIPEFQLARQTFQRVRSRRTDSGYQHPYAEFRFIQIAAFNLGLFWCSSIKKTPSAKDKASAIGHINALVTGMTKHGVGFDKIIQDLHLIQELELLKEHLSAAERRPREDDTQACRELNMELTRQLAFSFGVASSQIVKHLSSAAGCDLDDRTIELHIAAAQDRK